VVQPQILERQVYLVERLDSNSKSREPMMHLRAM
jgi:hypothetical protein